MTSDDNNHDNQQNVFASWRLYLLPVTLGIVFSLILFQLAWQTEIDNRKREFELESVSLSESISQRLGISEDALAHVSALLNANPLLAEQQLDVFLDGLQQRHDFVLGAFISSEFSADSPQDLPIAFQSAHRTDLIIALRALTWDDLYPAIVRLARESNATVPAPPVNVQGEKVLWLLRSVEGEHGKMHLAGLLVDPGTLAGDHVRAEQADIQIYTETPGVSGRQLIYVHSIEPRQGLRVARFEQENLLHLPAYSIKLVIDKPLHWSDIDRGLIFTALPIGLGVTLLLIALVRAKELQAQELQRRNAVIERQVELQTRELADARDQALEASRVKSDFLASMSHEIRTPLNAIIGMSELLSETRLSQEQQRYVEIFRKASEALLSLVNDILDLSKIEARQLVLESIAFDLEEVLEEAAEIYALKASEKGIELNFHIEPDVHTIRLGDPARLRQILLNLISNALKFTEQGEISIRVRNARGIESDSLEFSVRDTGIGIHPDKLDLIFGSFTQADSSTTRKYGGTGLGLTICRRLIDLMQGDIRVESKLGQGSMFIMTVELPRTERTERRRVVPHVDMRNRRVLVVDDNDTNRLILRTAMEAAGASVVEAADADTALQYVRDADPVRPYDLILLDRHLPGSDGLDVAGTMRSLGLQVNTILMASSADINEDMTRVRELGLGGYLVKPLKRAELMRVVAGVLGEGVDIPEAAPSSISPDSSEETERRLLLVEDNPDNRLLVKAYLKMLPFAIDEAENGEQAVELFQDNAYDLILMDVQMPIMDGHEATRRIRQYESEHGREPTPIVALTAHAIKEEIDKCLASGCDSHLSKPIKKSVLIDTLDRYLESRK